MDKRVLKRLTVPLANKPLLITAMDSQRINVFGRSVRTTICADDIAVKKGTPDDLQVTINRIDTETSWIVL